MSQARPHPFDEPLPGWKQLLLGTVAIAAFHMAHQPGLASVMVLFLAAMTILAVRCQSEPQVAFYFGLVLGLALYVPPLTFFWQIFNLAAVVLWLILAFYVGLFFLLVRNARVRFGRRTALVLIPVLWTGLEYFRSELYPLRFSWLTPGWVLADDPALGPLVSLGVYGASFVLLAGLVTLFLAWNRSQVALAILVAAGLGWVGWKSLPLRHTNPEPVREVRVAGLQLEVPQAGTLILALDDVMTRHPKTQLVVLSEYTLPGIVTGRLKDWCREHRVYLVICGKEQVGHKDREFYNTAFVVDPEGRIVFRQAKSVPIQFFNDGLPAREQKVWESPWGKLGIGICYDLSYGRVMDRLIRQGAEALIIPAMDATDWGLTQHELNARLATVRAREYGVPVFRVASSGISQVVNARGQIEASAPFPGQGDQLAGTLQLAGPGRRVWDRYLGLACVVVTVLVGIWLLLLSNDDHLQNTLLVQKPGYLR